MFKTTARRRAAFCAIILCAVVICTTFSVFANAEEMVYVYGDGLKTDNYNVYSGSKTEDYIVHSGTITDKFQLVSFEYKGLKVHTGSSGDVRYYYLEDIETLVVVGNGSMDSSVSYVNGATFCPWQEYGALRSLIIAEGVTGISNYMFQGVTSLERISFPSTLESIPGRAFSGCSNLQYVYIPEGVRYIDDGAFENCTSLNTVFLPSTISHIGKNAFDETRIKRCCYEGDLTQWERDVSVMDGNTRLTENNLVTGYGHHYHNYTQNEYGIVICYDCYHASDIWMNEFEARMNSEEAKQSMLSTSKRDIDLGLFFVPNTESGTSAGFAIACLALAFGSIFVCAVTKVK